MKETRDRDFYYPRYCIHHIYYDIESTGGTFRKTPAIYVKLKWTRIAETDAFCATTGIAGLQGRI